MEDKYIELYDSTVKGILLNILSDEIKDKNYISDLVKLNNDKWLIKLEKKL